MRCLVVGLLLCLGQCLGDGVCGLDRERSLAGSPSLDSTRGYGELISDNGGSATELADNDLHHIALDGRWTLMDTVGKPHNPAACGHDANDSKSLRSERHSTRREWGGALNPTVKITDWFECHSGGLLGCFDGGEKVGHVVTASAASLLSNVGAGEFFAVEPCLLCLEAVTGELGGDIGLLNFVEFRSKSLDVLVVRVEVVVVRCAVSLKLDVGVVIKSAAGLSEFGLDFGSGASGHLILVVCVRPDCLDTRKIRRKFVDRKNFLRLFFVCAPIRQFLPGKQLRTRGKNPLIPHTISKGLTRLL